MKRYIRPDSREAEQRIEQYEDHRDNEPGPDPDRRADREANVDGRGMR